MRYVPRMRIKLLIVAQLALVVAAAGCGGGTVDVTASRGAHSFHFSAGGCGVHFTGFDTAGDATAVDLACPDNLLPPRDGASLHLSILLATPSKEVPLRDEKFSMPAYTPPQLVV